MSNEIQQNERLEQLQIVANQVGNVYSAEQIGIVQKNVAKGTTLSELAYFLNVCKTMDLNPFNKEVWCYKDARGNLLIFSGRDGFLAKAQKNPFFNGIRSIDIRENDTFQIDIINNKISHEITKPINERGAILYGVAIVFRKDGEPTIEVADFDTYNKGYNTWKTHPAEMIKKVAECHALKKAFGISGIQSEYDFDVQNNIASPAKIDDYSLDRLKKLFHFLDDDSLSPEEAMNIQRIIDNKEEASYKKAIQYLEKLK